MYCCFVHVHFSLHCDYKVSNLLVRYELREHLIHCSWLILIGNLCYLTRNDFASLNASSSLLNSLCSVAYQLLATPLALIHFRSSSSSQFSLTFSSKLCNWSCGLQDLLHVHSLRIISHLVFACMLLVNLICFLPISSHDAELYFSIPIK